MTTGRINQVSIPFFFESVAFPSFSRGREKQRREKRESGKINKISLVFSFPLSFFLPPPSIYPLPFKRKRKGNTIPNSDYSRRLLHHSIMLNTLMSNLFSLEIHKSWWNPIYFVYQERKSTKTFPLSFGQKPSTKPFFSTITPPFIPIFI